MIQIDMAFVDALEREKARKQSEEEQRPQPHLDDRTMPFCVRVGHHVFGTRNTGTGAVPTPCIYCGRTP